MASRDNVCDNNDNALAKARFYPTNIFKDKENVVTAKPKARVPASAFEVMDGEGLPNPKAKDGSPSQKQKRSGSGSGSGSGGKRTSKISKRRRLNKSSRSRCIIPEARVIQAYNERAYIYDSENDGGKGGANGGYSIEAETNASVADMPEWLFQKIQQKKEEKMDGKANNNVNGRSRHKHARCNCFDCW